MYKLFLFLIGILFLKVLIEKRLIIRVDTIFRRSFRRHNDKIYGVYCWNGKQGTGKTYSVFDWLSEVRGNKVIITNVYSFYLKNKDICIYNDNFYDIIYRFVIGEYGTNNIIFFDELFSLIEKGKLSKEVLLFISQLRKRHIIFCTTAQEWLEINVTFRRYIRYKIDCSMIDIPFFGTLSLNSIYNSYAMKWDNQENEYICPIIKSTLKKCSRKIADSYDTDETIQALNSDLMQLVNKYKKSSVSNVGVPGSL